MSDIHGPELKFHRGSIFKNMWTFNPLKWKSEIFVEITGHEVQATFNINTFGQTVRDIEVDLWDSFINNFRLYLTKNIDYETVNRNELRRTMSDSFKLLLLLAIRAIGRGSR